MIESLRGLLPGFLPRHPRHSTLRYSRGRIALRGGRLAMKRFRDTLWEGCPPVPGCDLSVRMHREAPTDYTVSLHSIVEFARDKTTRRPCDQMKKARLREWLGIRD